MIDTCLGGIGHYVNGSANVDYEMVDATQLESYDLLLDLFFLPQ
jgi:hypothetical protein